MRYHQIVKKSKPVNEKTQRIIYIVLLSITGALVVVLITGTIIGLSRNSDEPLISSNRSDRTLQKQTSAALPEDDMRVYNGLGRLRIPLVNSSTLILSISFPYSQSDVSFTEELAAKINDLRTLSVDYFSNLPEDKLIQINEDDAKREILRRYNAVLRLGRIDVLYFNDMMIIDSIN